MHHTLISACTNYKNGGYDAYFTDRVTADVTAGQNKLPELGMQNSQEF